MSLKTTDWLELNLGIKPGQAPPIASFAVGKRPETDEDFQREIIDFHSEAPEGAEFCFCSGRNWSIEVSGNTVAEKPCAPPGGKDLGQVGCPATESRYTLAYLDRPSPSSRLV